MFGHRENVVGPNTGRVHDRRCRDGEYLFGQLVTTHDAVDTSRRTLHNVKSPYVIRDICSKVERRCLGERECNAGVIAPCVVVEKTSDELVGAERWQMRKSFFASDLPVSMANSPSSSEVVQAQGRCVRLDDRL